MEHVNHPKHYNQHPAGIECIDIIRHYTCDIANAIKYLWRAGLKPEMGKEDAEKEIEDLKKALWYIEDFWKPNDIGNLRPMPVQMRRYDHQNFSELVQEITGYSIEQIVNGYNDHIKEAMEWLLTVGIMKQGVVYRTAICATAIAGAIDAIQHRILDIECSLTEKELKETVDVLHGQAVDGMDYVSKPGGVRETEPEKYDPLNMIVAWGRVYSLTDEVRKKDNGALYGPCDNCALSEYCVSQDGTESLKNLCNVHGANDQQYYREVGIAKYSPKFGTVEVVDEKKEMELELKRLEDEGI